jgi:hypothetical protein
MEKTGQPRQRSATSEDLRGKVRMNERRDVQDLQQIIVVTDGRIQMEQ